MKFSLLGDLHYSENYLANANFDKYREEYFSTIIQAFFQQEADYYVSIGDLTNYGSSLELLGIYTIIQRYQEDKKFLHIIGNHDMYTMTREEISNFIHQKNYFSIITDEYCILVIDSTLEKNLPDWSGYLDPEQLSWIQQTLEDNANKNIVIFSHHPIYDTTLTSTVEMSSIDPEIPIKSILEKHTKPALFVCGHTHVDSIVQKDNWTYVQIAAILDQPSIRNIEFTSDKITIQSYEFDPFVKQTGIWLGAHMTNFELTNFGYQGPENREYTIKFN